MPFSPATVSSGIATDRRLPVLLRSQTSGCRAAFEAAALSKPCGSARRRTRRSWTCSRTRTGRSTAGARPRGGRPESIAPVSVLWPGLWSTRQFRPASGWRESWFAGHPSACPRDRCRADLPGHFAQANFQLNTTDLALLDEWQGADLAAQLLASWIPWGNENARCLRASLACCGEPALTRVGPGLRPEAARADACPCGSPRRRDSGARSLFTHRLTRVWANADSGAHRLLQEYKRRTGRELAEGKALDASGFEGAAAALKVRQAYPR